MAGSNPSLKRKSSPPLTDSGKKPKLSPAISYQKDGSTIYLTPITYLRSKPEHMLSLRQLLYEDLLVNDREKRTLEAAFMTTYCHEDEFIAPIVQSGVRFCLVTHGGRGGKVEQISKNYTVIFPKMRESWGKFHPKLYLLKFPTSLRVVVTSANLMKHDWSEIGQTIWFQDFQMGSASGDFHTSLASFTAEMIPNSHFSLQRDLNIDLNAYDFSTVKVALLASIPGRYRDISSYGLGRMHSLVKATGNHYSHATFQFSSISGLSASFLKQVKASFTDNENCELGLIYPTVDRVRRCHRGLDAGLTTFLAENLYKSTAFPKASMQKLEDPPLYPEITGHLSHSKVLIVTNTTDIDDDSILYFGSHNLSSSAWGRYEKGETQIFMGNYELGIVFLPAAHSAAMKQAILSRLPFKYPATQYEAGDEPWMIDVHHPEEPA